MDDPGITAGPPGQPPEILRNVPRSSVETYKVQEGKIVVSRNEVLFPEQGQKQAVVDALRQRGIESEIEFGHVRVRTDWTEAYQKLMGGAAETGLTPQESRMVKNVGGGRLEMLGEEGSVFTPRPVPKPASSALGPAVAVEEGAAVASEAGSVAAGAEAATGVTRIPSVGQVMGTAGKTLGIGGAVAMIVQEGLNVSAAVNNAKADGDVADPGQAGVAAVAADGVGMVTGPLAMVTKPISIAGRSFPNPVGAMLMGQAVTLIPQQTATLMTESVSHALESAPSMVAQALGPERTQRGLTRKNLTAAMSRLPQDFESLSPREAIAALNRAANGVVREIDSQTGRRDASWPFTSERRLAIAAVADAQAAHGGLRHYSN